MVFEFINANLLYILLGGFVTLAGLGLAIYGSAFGLKRARRISRRVDQFVAPEFHPSDNPKASPIVMREMSGSLFKRTVVSGFNKILNYLGRFAPQKMAAEIEHKLTIARRPGNLNAASFFAIRLLFLMGGFMMAYLTNRDLTNLSFNTVILGLLAIIVSWLMPMSWLNGKVRRRQDEIQRALPDALDMLSVCASAGLAFDQSLQKISAYWDNELGYELRRVTQEMEMGVPRSEALRNLSKRLDVDDLTRFIATIIQAEKIGMSYAAVLHSQAIQMRILRQLRAKEIANKLPGKMILPVALFIFPAMLAVILGPAIPILLNLF